MSKFYMLEQNDANDTADLYIFGNIAPQWSDDDPDRGASDIIRELSQVTANNIIVHIASYGGDVKEGFAIYNTLKNSGKNITTIDESFACSAASVVFMAGSKRIMNSSSLLMIHNPWTTATGNAADFRKTANDLDTINQAAVNAYKEHSTLDEATIKDLMNKETWILPEQALDYGMATEVLRADDANGVQQSAMPSIMQKLTAPEITAEPIKPAAYDDSAVMARLDALSQKADAVIEAVVKALQPKAEPKQEPKPNKTGFNAFWN